ncbi:MAG TPA: hypothetical protein VKL40_13275 [Candidatus Angelobacter sp.]|nr:hypothetical protein [Candidatus Angelobacter sp.]
MRGPLHRLHRDRSAIVAWVGLLFPAAAFGFQAAQNQAQQSVQQYRMAAQQALTGPFRVDVQPVQQGVKPGSPAVLKVVLRNANNQEVKAREKTRLEVTATSPSKAAQKLPLELAPGASSGEVTLTPKEAGLWKLEVRESYDHLRSGSNYLLVSSSAKMAAASSSAAKKKKSSKPATTRPPGGAFMFAPRLVLAAYAPPYRPPQGPPIGNTAPGEILLTVSGEGGGRVRADGISAARVTVFLTSPRTTDARVWLAVTQGQLAAPLVTIKAGDVAAEVDWSSTTVGQATVSISNTSPKINGEDQASANVEFIDPIVAIAFVQPLTKINIVEMGTIAVRFVDRNAVPVKTHAPFSYSFHADSPHVKLMPESDQTKPGAIDFATSVAPAAFGSVTVEAAVPGYQPIRHTFEVTGFLLLGLCVLGGALGGLVNHYDRKQKGLAASLLTGMVVALPITWLYVWVGLPNISAGILHNQLSAVMVAIIAGVSGASGLKLASKKAGVDLFEGSPDDKSGGATA